MSEITVIGEPAPAADRGMPPVDDVHTTRKEVIGDPPFDAEAVKDTATRPGVVGVTVTPVGALGGPSTCTTADALEGALVPAALDAVTTHE